MEEQQQQEYPYQQQGGGGYPSFDSKADLLDKIRPEEAVEQIKQRLMGKEWDGIKEEWVQNPALQSISLTEIGACAITNLIFPASTRNVSVSNLNDEEIKKDYYL